MACTPYNPATGLFYTVYAWGSVPSSGIWTFRYNREQAGMAVYQLSRNGTVEDELHIETDKSVRWVYFGNYLAVSIADIGIDSNTYTIWIYTLVSGAVTRYIVPGGPYSSSATSPQLFFQPSQDFEAFFIFLNHTGINSSKSHKVFRTSNGDLLCSHGNIIDEAQQRIAEITADREVKIKVGGDDKEVCPLPIGKLVVDSPPPPFPQVVIGGPPSLASSTAQFTLRNEGNDCLTVISISDVSPFSVTSTSRSLPADLDPGDSMTVEVTFSPGAIGSFGPVGLSITYTPDTGPRELICQGNARNAEVRIGFDQTILDFGTLRIGESKTKALNIRNDGEAVLNVSITASSVASPFQWSAFNGAIPYGGDQSIDVIYTPTAEVTDSSTLSIESNDPDSPHPITLRGAGCIPEASIVPPLLTPIDFGPIQRGFRTVRIRVVKNVGDGPLTFQAHIEGSDAALFGLQPQSGSVTDVLPIRSYTVYPQTPCGSGSSGSGEAIVAVAFHANDVPRLINAELVIDDHNDTNTETSEWRIPLQAEIIAVESVDVVLVLDRSGSMGETLGSRDKSEAAIAGGRLFVQLSREDVEDRIAVVAYNQIPMVIREMLEITAANKQQVVEQINRTNFAPTGSTAIAGGMMAGFQEMESPRITVPPLLHKAMVVLTDGKDNTAYKDPETGQWYSLLGGMVRQPGTFLRTVMTEPIPIPEEVSVYGIGLGLEEDIDRGRLEQICSVTGAPFRVTGNLTGDTYFNLEKYFTEIYMELASDTLILDPVNTIAPQQEHSIEFDVLKGDVSALVVIFDKQGIRLPFHISTNSQEIIDVTSVPSGFQLRSGVAATARFIEIRFPQGESDRYVGRWKVVVSHPGEICRGIPVPGRMTARKKSDSPDDAHPCFGFVSIKKCQEWNQAVDYGISIGVGSNFRMQPYLSPGIIHVGQPILLSAQVTEAGLPMTGCRVSAKVVLPSGRTQQIMLYDDGKHNDGESDDGEYAVQFLRTVEAGSYQFTFRAEGWSRDGEPVVREATRSKYIEGHIPISPTSRDPAHGLKECCCRLIILLAAGLCLEAIIILLLLRLLGVF
jgi:hypothetical protein